MTKRNMVVKDNSLIGANYSLGVAEQRLVFLAIIEAREQDTLIKAGGLLRISAQSYAKQFNVEKHTAYEAMKRAVDGLFEAEFRFSYVDKKTGKAFQARSRFVDEIAYADDLGCVELVFAGRVVPLITRLEKRYTEYDLKQVSALQSEYAIRLYELIIQWRNVGKVPLIQLQDLRNQLGVETEQYKKMNNFKAKVLDYAINQVNEYTDITVGYVQHKDGRKITGFTFEFKIKKDEKKIVSNVGNDTIEGLSGKQLGRITRNPQFITDYNHMVSPTSPAGQSDSGWEFEMVNRLKKDASKFKKRPIKDYLDY